VRYRLLALALVAASAMGSAQAPATLAGTVYPSPTDQPIRDAVVVLQLLT
jgi:hypothetical protein